jgi:hypothetical protein
MMERDQSAQRGLRLLALGLSEGEYRRIYGPLCQSATSILQSRAEVAIASNQVKSLWPAPHLLKHAAGASQKVERIQSSKDSGNVKAKADRAEGRARTLALAIEYLERGPKTSTEIASAICRTTNAVVAALSDARKRGVVGLKSTKIRDRVFWFLDAPK